MSSSPASPNPAASGETKPAAKPVVLTCAQPTGKLHLGNYLGAVINWGRMQEDYECHFGIVDWHAITMPYTPADLRRNTYECLAQYLACGLDPAKSHLFVQSHVTGHTELSWILGCLCPLGWLERMTQFKDKSQKLESVGSGLLTYPVLMAADILLYNAAVVPVGEDQKQHLELARDLAEKFNRTYSETFVVPEPFIGKSGARIMSLQNPESKMSKSDPNPAGVVFITDTPEVIRKKIRGAVTDTGTEVRSAADKPGVTNLLSILSGVTGEPIASIENRYESKFKSLLTRIDTAIESPYRTLKDEVAEAVIKKLDPVRLKYETLIKNKAYLESVMKSGADAAQRNANRTMSKVYRKTGFVERPR